MLFLLFQLGKDRYALEASRVVEVVPLLELKQVPRAPKGVAGILNYRGQPVPVVDLCALTLGQPARELFSTRIIIVNYPDGCGQHLLGLIAERVTEVVRRNPKDFVDSGVKLAEAPYLGPVLMDDQAPIQWIYEHRLLPDPVRNLLFSQPAALVNEAN